MTKDYLHYLRKRAINQQQKVDLLLNLLCGNAPSESHSDVEIIMEESEPLNLSNIGKRHLQNLQRYTQETYQAEHLLHNEKEPASSLFLKLSQMSLKWLELELAIVKELQRSEDAGAAGLQTQPLNEEELAIVKDYLMMIDEPKNRAIADE